MICANPDHLVERGERLVWCAGALAALYEGQGGNVVYAGKPHAPIYQLALRHRRQAWPAAPCRAKRSWPSATA